MTFFEALFLSMVISYFIVLNIWSYEEGRKD